MFSYILYQKYYQKTFFSNIKNKSAPWVFLDIPAVPTLAILSSFSLFIPTRNIPLILTADRYHSFWICFAKCFQTYHCKARFIFTTSCGSKSTWSLIWDEQNYKMHMKWFIFFKQSQSTAIAKPKASITSCFNNLTTQPFLIQTVCAWRRPGKINRF